MVPERHLDHPDAALAELFLLLLLLKDRFAPRRGSKLYVGGCVLTTFYPLRHHLLNHQDRDHAELTRLYRRCFTVQQQLNHGMWSIQLTNERVRLALARLPGTTIELTEYDDRLIHTLTAEGQHRAQAVLHSLTANSQEILKEIVVKTYLEKLRTHCRGRPRRATPPQ